MKAWHQEHDSYEALHSGYQMFYNKAVYSRTSMARTSLGSWKLVLDMPVRAT